MQSGVTPPMFTRLPCQCGSWCAPPESQAAGSCRPLECRLPPAHSPWPVERIHQWPAHSTCSSKGSSTHTPAAMRHRQPEKCPRLQPPCTWARRWMPDGLSLTCEKCTGCDHHCAGQLCLGQSLRVCPQQLRRQIHPLHAGPSPSGDLRCEAAVVGCGHVEHKLEPGLVPLYVGGAGHRASDAGVADV